MNAERLAFDDWAAEQSTWAQTTEKSYRRYMGYFFDWLEENDIPLCDCKIRQARLMVSERGWGNSSERLLNAVLVQFVRHRFGNSHPLSRWTVKRHKPKPQRTLTLSEANRLLASFQPGIVDPQDPSTRRWWVCDTQHPLGIRNLAIVLLLAETGFRSRELASIEMKHVDLENRSITALCKGGEWCTRFYTPSIEDHLHNWLALRAEYENEHTRDRLFIGVHHPDSQGKPLTHNGLRVMIRKLGNVTGITPLSPHVFRRSKATMMQTVAGAPSRVVQVEMDWHNIEMAERYSLSMGKESAKQFLPGTFLDIPAVVDC